MTLRSPVALIAGLAAAVTLAPAGGQAVTPVPGPDEAVITVRVGGDRVSGAITDTGPADAAINGLAGVRLGLFASPTDGAPIAQSWATCTSDSDGDCSFRVPDTGVGGSHRDARFTVEQLSAPPGWSATTSLRTYTQAQGRQTTPYRFLTGPELRAGTTYSSSSDFMYAPATTADLDVAEASDGVWQPVRDNPAVVDRCGLDVALILDTSSSVGSALPQLIDAADGLVDALTGTRSRAAAFSFSALSPGAAAGPNHPELTSISTADGAAAFKQEYASWGISSGTSWDRGLFAAASAPEHYDVAVIITDGNPDLYGDPRPAIRSVKATRFKELEYGIASANALKARGTRVIALGVGTGIGLAPISGPTAYNGANALQADRFALSDYQATSTALHELATSLCRGSVSVVTELVPDGNVGDDVSGASPVGAGWSTAASSESTAVTGLPSTATTTADGTGTVVFPLGFSGGAQQAQLRLAPVVPPGYHQVAHAGASAQCLHLGSGSPVPVVDLDAGAFSVQAAPEDALSCTVYVAADPLPPQTELPPASTGFVGPLLAAPLNATGRVTAISDANGDARLDPGDAISYEFVVVNASADLLTNVLVESPLIGAVVCPDVSLAPATSMTCVGHAPYVVADADAVAGGAAVSAVARAVTGLGYPLSSSATVVTTPIGDQISVAQTVRERP